MKQQQQPHEVIIIPIYVLLMPGWKTHKIKGTDKASAIKLDVGFYGDLESEDVNNDIMERLRRYCIYVTAYHITRTKRICVRNLTSKECLVAF